MTALAWEDWQRAIFRRENESILAAGFATETRIVGVIDSRTCLECLRDDGRVLSLRDAIRREPLPHRGCTCVSLNREPKYRLRAHCNCVYARMGGPMTSDAVERDECRRKVRVQLIAERTHLN